MKSNSNTTAGNSTTRARLAMRVFVHPNIRFASRHVSGKLDEATPDMNIIDTAILDSASRSCYENAPCGETPLGERMLSALLSLADTYSFRISEIAGGSHSKNSKHYDGIAVDFDQINGEAVSAKNKHVEPFMTLCKKLGSKAPLGPGYPGHAGHVHAEWPPIGQPDMSRGVRMERLD